MRSVRRRAEAGLRMGIWIASITWVSKEASVQRLMLVLVLAIALPGATQGAASTDALSERELARGVKDALSLGAGKAVARLGQDNGFLLDARVRIPLPDKLAGIDSTARRFGMGRYTDELVAAMNHAAEAAVPEAGPLLIDAVKKLSVSDAREIVAGGNDNAATRYFRKNTDAALMQRLLPIVTRATKSMRVSDSYNQVAGRAVRFGLLRPEDAKLDEYVTRKTLDGLYLVIAEEERAIRARPQQQAQSVLRRVFGALAQ
ncbi:MAG: DUF4197 domain-containing protein [Betaproteobacteria bacterium]